MAGVDPKPMRCGIYCRVSTPRQRELGTIRTQLSEVPRYAEAQGWTVVDTYIDDGISGTKGKDHRPELERLLDAVESGVLDVVLMNELDRSTRAESAAERAYITDTLREAGVKLATPKDGLLDLRNEDQDFMVDVRLAMAKWDRRKLARAFRRGKLRAARDNLRSASIDPYGLIWDPLSRSYRIDPREAYVVRRIYELATEGEGIAVISTILAQEGLQTRGVVRRSRPEGKPGPIATSTISKILHATTYKGEFVVFAKSDKIPIKVPPIVTPEEWDDAQRAIASRKVETRWRHDHQYLLSGVLKCGVCGYAMWATPPATERKGHKSHAYYRCSTTNAWRKYRLEGPCGQRHHRVDVADVTVWRKLAEVLSTPSLLHQACSLSGVETKDWAAEVANLQSKLADLEKHVGETLRRSRRGLITSEAADAALEDIARERRIIERTLKRAEGNLASSSSQQRRIEAVEAQAAELTRGLLAAPFETKRKLVRLIVPDNEGCAVVIHRDGSIEIKGVLPIPGEPAAELRLTA